jgi:DNA-binding transcriptional activator of the SARP family
VRLRTFGGLGIEEDTSGELGAAARRRRPLALLLLLASARERGLSRDKLMGYLWPESDTEHARNALRQTLHSLRRSVGENELILGTTTLRLNPQVIESDLADFDAALQRNDVEQAVATYRGPLADGFFLSGAAEFERWLETERARRAQQFAGAVELLALAAAGRGEHTTAVTLWHRLAVHEPLNARIVAHLIEALAAAGDRMGALRQARLHEAQVLEEFGIPPDPAILGLVERLRTPPEARPALRPRPITPAAVAAVVDPPTTRAAEDPAPHGWRRWKVAILLVSLGTAIYRRVAWRWGRGEL